MSELKQLLKLEAPKVDMDHFESMMSLGGSGPAGNQGTAQAKRAKKLSYNQKRFQ